MKNLTGITLKKMFHLFQAFTGGPCTQGFPDAHFYKTIVWLACRTNRFQIILALVRGLARSFITSGQLRDICRPVCLSRAATGASFPHDKGDSQDSTNSRKLNFYLWEGVLQNSSQ